MMPEQDAQPVQGARVLLKSDIFFTPMVVVCIAFPLPFVQIGDALQGIIAEDKRMDDAVIGSWLSIHRQTLPNQKNLLGKALEIIALLRCDQGIGSVSFSSLLLLASRPRDERSWSRLCKQNAQEEKNE